MMIPLIPIVVAAAVIEALRKARFPKAEGLFPMAGVENNSIPALLNHWPLVNEISGISDYPMGLPTLDLPTGIDSVSPILADATPLTEGFAPLDSPATLPATVVPQKAPSQQPVPVSLPHKKIPELPLLSRVSVQAEQVKEGPEAGVVENLLFVLHESGMKVKEVMALPSGTTKITLDELFTARQAREPELVRVRR